jgi:hypothetical protein
MTTADMIRATAKAIATGATCANCTESHTCPWADDVPCPGYREG